MRTSISKLALKYECPFCHARPDRPCKTPSGQLTRLPHLVRRRLLDPDELEQAKVLSSRPWFLQKPNPAFTQATRPRLKPRDTPCGSCPYRKDCPSGVWDQSEYEKLTDYDKMTALQPVPVFMCHSNRDDSTLCRGWLDVHDKKHSLALRIAITTNQIGEEILTLPKSDVPTFESGTAAANHGLADIDHPSPEALAFVAKLESHIQRSPR